MQHQKKWNNVLGINQEFALTLIFSSVVRGAVGWLLSLISHYLKQVTDLAPKSGTSPALFSLTMVS
jgi:hypothetical protein